MAKGLESMALIHKLETDKEDKNELSSNKRSSYSLE